MKHFNHGICQRHLNHNCNHMHDAALVAARQAVMAYWCSQVLFVEAGWGCDQHGQNVTVRPLV